VSSRFQRVRAKARALAQKIETIGPHPIVLTRTFLFLAARPWRRRRLDRLYRSPLRPAAVELQLPVIGLLRFHELPEALRIPAEAIRKEADHVLAHRVDLLGSGLVDLGAEIDWHRDFKTGYRWPEHFYQDVEVTRLDDSSDAKVPWELSRCHHLLTLARAARMFEEESYASEVEAQLVSWLDRNPPAIGINWVNPMEVAIRAVNLIWALATLEEWRPCEHALRERLITSLRWHGRHIHANLEGTPYLRSNHYLSDILGLLVLGWVFKGDPDAPSWFRLAHREFEREILKQVYSDGVSFESSLSYHGLVIEILLVARHIARSADKPFSRRFDDRLLRMLEVSRTVRHDNGRIPLFGDQDSGRVLPAGFARPPTHDNLLWLGAAEFEGRRPLNGPVHAEVAWTFGVEAWRSAAAFAESPEPTSAAFREGGLYVLRSDRTQVVIRCGDVGQNGFGGHSHNDMLSYELSVDGIPLVVDSGTYSYTSDVDARNYFRSTRAHNTLMVDGAEIHPIDPNRVFELRRFASLRVERVNLKGDILEFVASHDGFRRCPPPVKHQRTFSLNTARDELIVLDDVDGHGDHVIESFVHVAPDATLRASSTGSYSAAIDATNAILTWPGLTSDEVRIESCCVSSCYGIRESTSAIVATARRRCPATISYRITPAPLG
jgi:uncharacterized heparinase superfamily protein